jgi:hypothetical protein
MQYLPSLSSDLRLVLCVTAIAACGDDSQMPGGSNPGGSTSSNSGGEGGAGASGGDGQVGGSGGTETVGGAGGSGGGAETSCIDEGHRAGERYSLGDNCNFCDCNADGSTTCTDRTCPSTPGGCDYNGVAHLYGEVFPDSFGCNDCVCAASGLACTRRDCTTVEEGAILVESLDTPCGDDPTFTAQAVLDGLPIDDFETEFLYATDSPIYPETLPDTNVRIRVVHEGGFAVCRIPNPGQEAFDIEVVAEWITEDGSFDEGFHTYLRRNAGGFTDAWYLLASAPPPPNALDGTYNPSCLDANGFGFSVTFDASGVIQGDVTKTCETDILLTVGTLLYP